MKRFVLADGAKEEINKIFEKARVTKREVAELLDVTPITFYYKTCGKRSSFSLWEVEKLLDAFPEISKDFSSRINTEITSINAEITSLRKALLRSRSSVFQTAMKRSSLE